MIALIVAFDKKRAIGKNGRIPWNIPGEKDRFKALTVGYTVIMGRKTYEEIGSPLPMRDNIVISSTKSVLADRLLTASSLSDALKSAKTENVFIAGGSKLYEEVQAVCNLRGLKVFTYCYDPSILLHTI